LEFCRDQSGKGKYLPLTKVLVLMLVPGHKSAKPTPPIRLRVNWSGANPEKVRLFAIHLDHSQ